MVPITSVNILEEVEHEVAGHLFRVNPSISSNTYLTDHISI